MAEEEDDANCHPERKRRIRTPVIRRRILRCAQDDKYVVPRLGDPLACNVGTPSPPPSPRERGLLLLLVPGHDVGEVHGAGGDAAHALQHDRRVQVPVERHEAAELQVRAGLPLRQLVWAEADKIRREAGRGWIVLWSRPRSRNRAQSPPHPRTRRRSVLRPWPGMRGAFLSF